MPRHHIALSGKEAGGKGSLLPWYRSCVRSDGLCYPAGVDSVFTPLCLRPLCRSWELTWENESQFLFAWWLPGFLSENMASLSLHHQEAEFDRDKPFPLFLSCAPGSKQESWQQFSNLLNFPLPLPHDCWSQCVLVSAHTELIFFIVSGALFLI